MKKKVNEKEIRKSFSDITKTLIKKGLTITTMESCTGGLLASLITDAEGSSAVIKGAFVTYSNEAKIKAGVDSETIKKFSVYSKETALAMAESCRKYFSSDIGIGVTGTMGNIDEANPLDSEKGKIYFAIVCKDNKFSFSIEIETQSERYEYKLITAQKIADELKKIISSL